MKRFCRILPALAFLLWAIPILLQAQIVKPLNSPVNDPTARDGCPSISADGQTLLFLSSRNWSGNLRMYESAQIAADRWSPPRLILPEFYARAFVDGAFLTYDASTIYFHSSYEGNNNQGVEDIYLTKRKGSDWEDPENIGAPINSPGFEGYPSLSADGRHLYFVRMKKKQNCPVIMMSLKDREGKWLPPFELPPPINKSCEQMPRILPDGKTLLFASKRAGGKGGYDLYLSQRQPDGNWSEPRNLEYLNTEQDDVSATFSMKDQIILFENNNNIIQASPAPGERIMEQSFSIVQGTTKDALSFKPTRSSVIIRDLSAAQRPREVHSDPVDGSFRAVLPNGVNYSLEINSDGFIREKKEVNLATAQHHQLLEMDVKQLPEMIELHYRFTDSLSMDKIQPELTIYSSKDRELIPLTYDAKQNIFKAKVKLKHKYYIEASLEGYSTYKDQLQLEEVNSYQPVRMNKVMRRQFYLFTFKAVDKRSSRPLQETAFKVTDRQNQTRMFPYFDPQTGEYSVELREQGNYEIEMTANGYKAVAREIDSFQLIQSEKLDHEIIMESNF